MLQSVDLSDYMLTDPVCVKATDTVFSAIDIILQERISGVCVVDEDQRLLGILSEMDCLKTILSCTYNDVCNLDNVSAYMTEAVDAVQRHADLVNVAELMLSNSRRRLPVVENGVLVGMITCRQILKAFSDFNK